MAKKANSAYDGTLVQIKRTNLSINDESEKKKIDDDGKLKFGEPLLLNKEKYLIFGDGTLNTSDITDVFQSVPKERAEWISFFEGNATQRTQNGDFVWLTDQDGKKIFPRIKFFTTKDADGKTIDSMSREVAITGGPDSKWYKVDTSGIITNELIAYDDKDVFPKAQKISVAGINSNILPFINLSLTNEQLGSKTATKNAKKSFGNVTAVKSEQDENGHGYLIVYLGYKNLKEEDKLYIDVFGG